VNHFLYQLLLRGIWLMLADPSEGGRYQVISCSLGKPGPGGMELVITRTPVGSEWR